MYDCVLLVYLVLSFVYGCAYDVVWPLYGMRVLLYGCCVMLYGFCAICVLCCMIVWFVYDFLLCLNECVLFCVCLFCCCFYTTGLLVQFLFILAIMAYSYDYFSA